MASLDSLPADQRAVLQLVLQRGRSYDQIAQMLSIDRAAVRERALSAFDAIGPQTRVPPERRALITDYLLGQLPPRVAEQTRDRLGESPTERAWARVLAGELTSLAKDPLPEIPSDGGRRAAEPEPEPVEAAPEERPARRRRAAAPEPEPMPATAAEDGDRVPPDYGSREPEPAAARASSRRGGAILLLLGVLVAAIIVVIVVATSGGNDHSTAAKSTPTTASTPSTPSTTSTPSTNSTPTTSTSTTGAKVIGQVNLTSPSGSKTEAGVAQVIQQGTQVGIVIVAQGIAANTKHDAYAVWLYNSASDNHLLGFVNPAVKTDGKLQTAGVLPTNASHYTQLIVSLETQPKPKAPVKIVLEGAFKIS
jgi:Sigma-70, region 4